MTIQEKMTRLLEDNGLSPDQAQAVIQLAIADKSLKFMKTRWDDECGGYPSPLFAVVWKSIKYMAVEWMDANMPKHFARSMFLN
jgi:hypothetical protein